MISLNQDSLREWQGQDMEPIRYAYDLLPEDTVLDIGSYKREWGKEIEQRYGCKVEYFEALDNRAAWLFDGTIEMGGAFYYTTAFAKEKPHRYGCVDIAPYLQREIALVKINIEGGEYALLDYIIEKGLMGNITELQVQFHVIDNPDIDYEKVYKWLAEQLSQTHELTWRWPFCWENWRRKKEQSKIFHSV
jgi:hypothetical protein